MKRKDLDNLIALGEGFTTEFKRSGTANLGRELCAFANANGGMILIGVTDDGKCVGVQDHNRLKSEVQAIARTAEPSILVDVESVDAVLCIRVPAQQGKPYSFGGKFYLREGASSQQMARSEIREFFYREGLIHFDETPCNAYDLKKELKPSIWTRFIARSGIPESLDRKTALYNLHLVKDGKMTHAGAWLLTDDIGRYTLQAKIICALFQGATNAAILDRKEFSSDLYTNYQECMAYLKSKLNSAFIPTFSGRNERLELPEEALREALVNAIAHRDYRMPSSVQLHIFHDRLEIVSPGGLPAGMRKKDLGRRSVPRNPLLFGLLFRMNLVEQVGSGINRIRLLCKEYGVAIPKIEVEENWFTVVFSRPTGENQTTGASVTQSVTQSLTQSVTQSSNPINQVLSILSVHDELSSSQLREALNIRHRHLFRHNYLRPALTRKLIEMTIPDKPSSRLQKYRLTPKGKRALKTRIPESE